MSRSLETQKSAIASTSKPIYARNRVRFFSISAWRRRLRHFYRRFLTLQDSPEAIARGVACGVFAGLFPLFGLQTLIGIALAAIARGNKIAAAAATWVSNPLTYLPLYALNFQVGEWILGQSGQTFTRDNLLAPQELVSFGGDFLTRLFLGCLVMGITSAFFSYFLSLRFIRRVRRWQPPSSRRVRTLKAYKRN